MFKAVPVCCMIMTAKSTSAYTAGLTHFKEEFAPHFQPDVIMTDFETSLPNSIRSVYPQAKHVGCLFHYCQVSRTLNYSYYKNNYLVTNHSLFFKIIFFLIGSDEKI